MFSVLLIYWIQRHLSLQDAVHLNSPMVGALLTNPQTFDLQTPNTIYANENGYLWIIHEAVAPAGAPPVDGHTHIYCRIQSTATGKFIRLNKVAGKVDVNGIKDDNSVMIAHLNYHSHYPSQIEFITLQLSPQRFIAADLNEFGKIGKEFILSREESDVSYIFITTQDGDRVTKDLFRKPQLSVRELDSSRPYVETVQLSSPGIGVWSMKYGGSDIGITGTHGASQGNDETLWIFHKASVPSGAPPVDDINKAYCRIQNVANGGFIRFNEGNTIDVNGGSDDDKSLMIAHLRYDEEKGVLISMVLEWYHSPSETQRFIGIDREYTKIMQWNERSHLTQVSLLRKGFAPVPKLEFITLMRRTRTTHDALPQFPQFQHLELDSPRRPSHRERNAVQLFHMAGACFADAQSFAMYTDDTIDISARPCPRSSLWIFHNAYPDVTGFEQPLIQLNGTNNHSIYCRMQSVSTGKFVAFNNNKGIVDANGGKGPFSLMILHYYIDYIELQWGYGFRERLVGVDPRNSRNMVQHHTRSECTQFVVQTADGAPITPQFITFQFIG